VGVPRPARGLGRDRARRQRGTDDHRQQPPHQHRRDPAPEVVGPGSRRAPGRQRGGEQGAAGGERHPREQGEPEHGGEAAERGVELGQARPQRRRRVGHRSHQDDDGADPAGRPGEQPAAADESMHQMSIHCVTSRLMQFVVT